MSEASCINSIPTLLCSAPQAQGGKAQGASELNSTPVKPGRWHGEEEGRCGCSHRRDSDDALPPAAGGRRQRPTVSLRPRSGLVSYLPPLFNFAARCR
jgi:hypothetical protein